MGIMKYYYSEKNENQQNAIEEYIYSVNFFRYNWHSDIELFILLRGTIDFCIEGNKYEMFENDVILVNANCGHAVISKDDNSMGIVLHISPEVFTKISRKYKNIEILCRSDETTKNNLEFRALRHYAAKMMTSAISNASGRRFIFEGSYYTLLGILLSDFPTRFRDINEQKTSLKYKKTINNYK